MNMKIKNVNIIPVSRNNGLIAFASLMLDDDILLSSIAVYKKLDGGFRLLYPSKCVRGSEMTVFHPLNRNTSKAIEEAIFEKIKDVKNKGCENDRYYSASVGC